MSLIVVDQEFEQGGKCINDMAAELNEIFRSYSVVIQKLQQEGICDTEINNVLSTKVNTLNTYAKEFREISALLVNKTKTFLTDLDEADAYLYD